MPANGIVDRRIKLAQVGASKAMVTGGFSRWTKRVAAGCNGNPYGCAEDDVARQIGFSGPASILNRFALKFTKPVRPRTGEDRAVCARSCQNKYSPRMFPRDVKVEPGGKWGRPQSRLSRVMDRLWDAL